MSGERAPPSCSRSLFTAHRSRCLEIDMLGYDWPRLHARPERPSRSPCFSTAVLFDLLALATATGVLPAGELLDPAAGRGRRRGRGAVRPPGGGAHRPRRRGSPGHGDSREAGAHHPRASSECWRCGASCESGGWVTASGRELLLSLAGVGVLFATGLYGGRLVFEHAAGFPPPCWKRAQGARQGPSSCSRCRRSRSRGRLLDGAEPAPAHVDPPGTPPHSHPPDTPAHGH